MENAPKPEASQDAIDNAANLWQGFTKFLTIGTVGTIILVILLALITL